MKKVLSMIMATAIVASMSVTAFAAAGDYYNSDLDSGFAPTTAGSIYVDGIVPNTTFYYELGASTAPIATAAQLVDGDLFKFSVDKDTNGSMIKSITLVTDKKMNSSSVRGNFIKVVLNDSTTTSEIKSTGDIIFKAKKTESTWTSGAKLVIPYTLWINNEKAGNDSNPGTGDRVYFEPEDNETNSLVWGDDRAALKFDANDDASKFYARLSTKSNSEVYATYGDPVNADLWFYDFVGNPTIPSTSRATLTLGLGWDSDDDYAPNPADVFIYEIDADGVLTDVTDKFTYSEDDTDIEGWSIKTRTLGSYVISDTELDLDVADVEDDDTDASAPTTDGGKEIPNTGSSDMVNVAVVAAVVSLAAAGAVAFRKVK